MLRCYEFQTNTKGALPCFVFETAISHCDPIQTPSLHFFLPVLPSGAHRPEADLPNPLRSFDSLLHPEKLRSAPVFASQPHDFNIPDLTGTVCPDFLGRTGIRTLRSRPAGS